MRGRCGRWPTRTTRPSTTSASSRCWSPPAARLADVEALAGALAGRGVDVDVVDGAHTAGLVPLPSPRPGVFLCLTLHKWLHLPRGTGFLVVPPDAAEGLRPVVTRWFADAEELTRRFAWVGTDDVIGHLLGAEAVAYQLGLEADGLADHRATLTAHALGRLLGLPWVTPLAEAPRAPSMVTVALPDGTEPEALRRALHRRSVDLWCGTTAEGPLLRLSVAPYTTPQEVDRGLDVLAEVLAGRR